MGKVETYSLEPRVSCGIFLWSAFTERERDMRRLTLSLNRSNSLRAFSNSCCSDAELDGGGVDGPGSDGGCAQVDGPGSDGGCAQVDGPGSEGGCAPVDGPESDGGCAHVDDPSSSSVGSGLDRGRFKSKSKLSCWGELPVDFGNSNTDISAEGNTPRSGNGSEPTDE